ncbi:CBS domain-containing protein [Streptosporangium sp. OZ121]|uniref:CBS domain-containing protein n=1 Tax=Streptosporangium sp. OZ121 TaxID=3444183 RepID=UPI003F791F7D
MHHVTVKEVMTCQVISTGENTCFKDIAETLLTHALSALPVVDDDGHVVGVVSEADLLRRQERWERFPGEHPPSPATPPPKPRADRTGGEVARTLMSTPAVTISKDASVAAAGRLMHDKAVKRLPVVDEHGHLAGIVSRCDLLKVFIRSDREIEHEVRVEVLTRSLWMDTSRVQVTVKDGVVTLSGRMTLRADTRITLWMTRQINGVVDVIDELTWDRDNTPHRGTRDAEHANGKSRQRTG